MNTDQRTSRRERIEPFIAAVVAVGLAAVPGLYTLFPWLTTQAGPMKYLRQGIFARAMTAKAGADVGAVQAYPTMPATVIAERIGWTHSIRILGDRIAELRPVYLPPDPASRTSYEAGDVAQCDLWFPPIELPVGCGQTRRPAELPVLTMVTGYSRWLSAVLIPSPRARAVARVRAVDQPPAVRAAYRLARGSSPADTLAGHRLHRADRSPR